jgi:hypothetical protein
MAVFISRDSYIRAKLMGVGCGELHPQGKKLTACVLVR